MGGEMRKIPYDDRTDLERIQSQWNKIGGILQRKEEWSAAIVRAATAAEIAANLSIRKRFEAESDFAPEFVNQLLRWANGLDGKLKRLIIPSELDKERIRELKALQKLAEKINDTRNAIVHSGFFSNENETRAMIELARQVIEGLVRPWEPKFALRETKGLKARKEA